MAFREERLRIERSQRVYVSEARGTKNLLLLHGYGQLGKYFANKFHAFENDYRIVIPEGLHRFYIEGFSGRVGASWMTKEDRLQDIAEQRIYLNKVLDAYQLEVKNTVLLAFSQGIATAARWMHADLLEFEQVIFWAGNFPPDLSIDEHQEYWSKQKLHYVFGRQDEFFSEERVQELYRDLNKRALYFKTHSGEFKHDINRDVLEAVLAGKSH